VIFAIARLVVPDGANIAWAKNYTYLKAGQTGKITLFFNGADILTQQKNGPYQLRDLFVYHSGDPEQGLYIDFPLNTQPYNLSDFEPFDNYFNIILPLILRLK
jgi:hypothetical protein